MAACAPLGGLYADHVLHVLDAFAIPGVVERGKMVRGALPLLVDVGVAALAALRLHKVGGWNLTVMQRLCGAGEEWARRSVAFIVHGGGSYCGVFDAMVALPGHFAEPIGACADGSGDGEEKGTAEQCRSGVVRSNRVTAVMPHPIRHN